MPVHALARVRSAPGTRVRDTSRFAARLAAMVIMSGSVASGAVAQGVRYTILPSASYIRWDTDLALERAITFGGRAIADFGPLVGLEAHYLTGGGIVGRFSETGITDSLGAPLENGTLDITDYGIGIRLNFGSARLAPFLRGGGSLLRFDEGARKGPRQIAVTYGGGIRLNVSSRMRAELFAEDMRFRLDRSALASAATPGTDPERHELRSNLTFGAGLGFVIGGARADAGPRERWSIASVPLEAFTGRIDFADAALGTHSLVGARAGIDAGNYVGLRAYYLRGVSSDFSRTEGVRSIGGEAQFNLNAAPRIAPYLVVGGGSLGFQSGYRDANGNEAADRTVLILGGGIGLRLSDKFRLNIAARDFIHTHDAAFGDVAAASELRHNWLLSAGVGVSIGRSRRGIALVSNDPQPAVVIDSATAAAAADSAALTDSTAATGAPTGARAIGAAAAADSTLTRRAERSYHSATSVVLPIPTEGELYIRYGPLGVRDSTVRAGGMSGLPGAGDAAVDTARTGAPDTVRMRAPDTAYLQSTMRRMFDERRRADSLVIRDLVAAEVGRWMSEEARRSGVAARNPGAVGAGLAPPDLPVRTAGDTALLALLRAERDSARMERLRLQLRFDSLEAAFRRDVAARTAASEQGARQAAADGSARAAERAEVERVAAERAAVERADADAALRGTEDLERRRLDALTLVERSIPSVTAIQESERGLVIVLGNNLFGVGQQSLADRPRIELRAVATLLTHYPEARIVVEGHTDSTGGAEANQRLSESRAESVRSALIAHGTSSDRITARGYGQTQPVSDNASSDGRARNRRAEIVILGVSRPRPTPAR